MITVTLYCKYPRRDGTTQNAVVKKHCLRETQIASTKKSAETLRKNIRENRRVRHGKLHGHGGF